MKLQGSMLCPVCEAGKLNAISKEVPFEYKGVEHVIKNIRAYECNVCNEVLWDERDERAIEKALTDIRRGIDGLLTSDEIKTIRQFFGMTQVEFAKALSVGEKNFARYESGQATQGRVMDNLLRAMRDFPNIMQCFCKEWPGWENRHQQMKASIASAPKKRRANTVVNAAECKLSDEELIYAHAV